MHIPQHGFILSRALLYASIPLIVYQPLPLNAGSPVLDGILTLNVAIALIAKPETACSSPAAVYVIISLLIEVINDALRQQASLFNL